MNDMTKFNYSLLPTDFQQEDIEYIEHCATDIEIGGRITIEGIMRIGKRLNDARSKFGENDKAFGQWRKGRLPWLESRTALNFMRVHSKFGGENLLCNYYRVEKLAPTILYALSAPSTPDSVIDKAIEKGADTKVSDVKKWKAMEAELEEEKRRAQEFREESNERRKKIRELEQQLELAERAEPEIKVVEKIIEKPMIPQEFSSLEDAIVAKRKDLENLDRNTQDAIQKNRTVYESRERLQREVEELTTLLSKHKASEREQVEHKRLTDSAMQFTALFIAEIQALEHAPSAEQRRRWDQAIQQLMDSASAARNIIDALNSMPLEGILIEQAA